jgi:hypothetical protein
MDKLQPMAYLSDEGRELDLLIFGRLSDQMIQSKHIEGGERDYLKTFCPQ